MKSLPQAVDEPRAPPGFGFKLREDGPACTSSFS
jgi:hypothetical protein